MLPGVLGQGSENLSGRWPIACSGLSCMQLIMRQPGPPALERQPCQLEGDEKPAVPMCSWFLQVGSARFRDSLNISVYTIRLDHLGWKGSAPGPGLAFFFISFIWEVGVLALQGSSVMKFKCSD